MKYDEVKYKKCIDFLVKNNCENIPHSHSNFLNHLVGTFNILKKWKQSEDLCFAGMFHNIYGNKYFNPNLNVTRDEIKKLIGNSSENLVFKFVSSDRTKINEGEDTELIILNLANSLDQRILFNIADDLYDKDSSENIHNYFKYVPWIFEGSNKGDISTKWKYNLNYRHPIEINFLELSDKLLKNSGLNKIFKLKRAYASANTYGFSGEYHYDDNAKEHNEVVSIMFYLNHKWDLNFGGETFFLNKNKNEIEHAVIPKPARAVIFDGFIYHGPRPLSKICNELRMVLTFKYELINK
jgi:hypothetical protein